MDNRDLNIGEFIKKDPSSDGQRFYRGKIRLIYKNAYLGIIATLINSLILIYILRSVIPHRILLIWFLFITIISIFRSYITFKYKRQPQVPEKTKYWDTLSFVSFTLSGVIWGAAGIYLFPPDSLAYQTFLVFVLGGMVAGAAGTFSIVPKYFFGYSIPALVPIMFRFFIMGDDIHLAMGLMVFLFGLLMCFTAKYLRHVTSSSLKHRFENMDLIDHLIEEKERIEKLNEKYKSEIVERNTTETKLMDTLKNLEETQDMLARSEKLAIIGRLASAIGHEVLNPVNIIHMRLQLLNTLDILPDKVKDAISICEGQIDRIVQIVRNIGQFARSENEEISIFTPAALDEVINYVLELYGPELKEKNIITDVRLHDDFPLISMDRNKIEQVLFNILSNSIDAMANKQDKLLIIRTLPGESGKYVQLIISDNGTGVEKINLEKIMDPFFTTKDSQKGSGLGLFMSYLIVKNHGGSIRVENNELGGTSIYIELPVDMKKMKDSTYEGFRLWQR